VTQSASRFLKDSPGVLRRVSGLVLTNERKKLEVIEKIPFMLALEA
jgi:hypothetical protein